MRNRAASLEPGTVTRGRGRPRDEETRARILHAALAAFEDTGFGTATVDAIAERAGASKATVYRWWPNKASLFVEALRETVAQELPFPDTGNLRLDIRLQLRNFITLLTGSHGGIFRAFLVAAQSDPEMSQIYRDVWIKPRRQQTKKLLQRHQRAGRLSTGVDLDTLLDLLYGPFYFRLLAGHGVLNSAFADSITDLAFNGIEKIPNGSSS